MHGWPRRRLARPLGRMLTGFHIWPQASEGGRASSHAGLAHYGTLRREGKATRIRPPSERVSIAVSALIDRGLWEQAQAKMTANIKVARPYDAYLLRGILHCVSGGACLASAAGTPTCIAVPAVIRSRTVAVGGRLYPDADRNRTAARVPARASWQ